MRNLGFPPWLPEPLARTLRRSRDAALRLLLTGLSVLLFGTGSNWARADLLVQWSALENLAKGDAEKTPPTGDDEFLQETHEFWTDEDTPLVLSTAEIFFENTPVALELATPPEHGHVTLETDGGFTYEPHPDFSGSDAFALRCWDEVGETTLSHVSLFVEPQNDPPLAAPSYYAITVGEALHVRAPGVFASCFDADGDALWISLDTLPTHGEVRLDDDGGFTYVPEAGFTGSDHFTFEISDGVEAAMGSVRVSVQLPAPITLRCDATDDASVKSSSANLCYGTEPQLRLQDGAATQRSYIRFSVLGAGDLVQKATLRLYCLGSSSDGGDLYLVENDFRGTQSPWDERRLSWNSAPLLVGPARVRLGSVVAGTWVEIDVSEMIRGDGIYSFGLSSRATDGARYSSKEGLHPPQLEIVAVVPREPDNTAPVAMDDTYEVTEDTPLEVYAPGLLENDRDEDGDYLVVVSRNQPTHGILVIHEEGGFVYRPHPDYNGPDSFTYTVGDLRGGMDTRTVALTVLAEADSPVAEADTWLLMADQALSISAPGVLANDRDADGSVLTPELLSNVVHGTLHLAEDGSFTYTPADGYRGTDSFVYRVYDGTSASLPVVVSLQVDASARTGKARALPESEPATTLDRIFPNPFGNGTWIEYRLARSSRVEAELFDVRGQRVRLLTAANQSPGARSLYWNGLDDRGLPLPTGIYFLRLRLGDALQTRKLVLQR